MLFDWTNTVFRLHLCSRSVYTDIHLDVDDGAGALVLHPDFDNFSDTGHWNVYIRSNETEYDHG